MDIHGVDILSDAALRAFMKEFSEWPTFPQLYINGARWCEGGPPDAFVGARALALPHRPPPPHHRRFPPCALCAGEFVGGCDIATQLNQSGELAKLLAAKPVA